MDHVQILRDALGQKENSAITYLKYMREMEDSDNRKLAEMFANLAKAEEKHIAEIKSHLNGSTEH